jgi:hypothetical protein
MQGAEGRKLTDTEKGYNHGLSAYRARVEHRIGRTIRFGIASDRPRDALRAHRIEVSIIAGLVNFEDRFEPF